MQKIVLILIALFVLASVSVGCSSGVFDLRQTVEAYNNSVSELYRTGSSPRLRIVASPAEQRRISGIFANMQAEGKFMESTLESIDFTEVSKSGKTIATVKTKENWSYRIFNQNEDPNGDYTKAYYEATYVLIKKKLSKDNNDASSSWRVDAVTITNEQKK